MNLFTNTFSKLFKISNQLELDKVKNLILAINNKGMKLSAYLKAILRKKQQTLKKMFKMVQ